MGSRKHREGGLGDREGCYKGNRIEDVYILKLIRVWDIVECDLGD